MVLFSLQSISQRASGSAEPHGELETQREDDGEVSHGQVEVPRCVDCAGRVETSHPDDKAIARQA